jgi:predicted RNA-binding protein with PUA-like domain
MLCAMNYWLMKSEPNVFSIHHLQKVHREPWDGVRNYQARNFMRDGMQIGDLILFYHSNANPPGVAGIAKVASGAYPDASQFNAASKYYDPKSTVAKPIWMLVDVGFVQAFDNVVPLPLLKTIPELSNMKLLQKGNRLSIMPVQQDEFALICKLGQKQ